MCGPPAKVANVERAAFLSSPGSAPAGNWSRFYYGSEFCPWTFPTSTSIIAAMTTARQHECRFTLVTPVVSEPFIMRLRKVLSEVLPLFEQGDEIVVSDLGSIRLVREISDEVTLVVGRALSGQKRGPRILDLSLNAVETDYFQRGSWYQAEAVAFLAEQHIHRIELDNLLQGLAPLPQGLFGTLHLPWAMVTSSRNCPFRPPGKTGPCPGGCGAVMELTTPQTPITLYQAGNSQFLKNETAPKNMPALGIDRVVEHHILPR